MKYFLAIDISASSGRHIVGWREDGELKTKEVYRSLAKSCAKALAELEVNTGCTYEKLYIVGGGAKNDFLNHLTAKATGKQVVALPIEATALGNLKIQMEADL